MVVSCILIFKWKIKPSLQKQTPLKARLNTSPTTSTPSNQAMRCLKVDMAWKFRTMIKHGSSLLCSVKRVLSDLSVCPCMHTEYIKQHSGIHGFRIFDLPTYICIFGHGKRLCDLWLVCDLHWMLTRPSLSETPQLHTEALQNHKLCLSHLSHPA